MNSKYLYGHTSPETAYIVEDYPWGYRLRTTKRYWIESKKGYGQRLVTQTINPKTGKWCAQKASTYTNVEVLYLNENDFVQRECLTNYSKKEEIEKFIETFKDNLTDFQKEELKYLIAKNKVWENVKVTIEPSKYGAVSLLSQKPEDIEKRRLIMLEQEQSKKEQDEVKRKICYQIYYEKSKIEIN